MKILPIAVFILAAISPAAADHAVPGPAAPAVTLNVWPDGQMPGHGASGPEEITPPNSGNVIHINNVSTPTLTLYKALNAHSAMIVCPGGGYGTLAYNKEGTEIAAWLNSLGITAVVLKYRVPGNRDGAFEDIQRAMRLVRAHAREWTLNPDKIGVIGFSAGGHLCARLSTNYDEAAYAPIDETDKLSAKPDFVALIYPAYLAKKLPPDKKPGETAPATIPDDPDLKTVAPELKISAAIPPTFIAQTEDDRSFIAGTKAYFAALQAAKVLSDFALYPKGGHGYGLRSDAEVKNWPDRCAAFLKQHGML